MATVAIDLKELDGALQGKSRDREAKLRALVRAEVLGHYDGKDLIDLIVAEVLKAVQHRLKLEQEHPESRPQGVNQLCVDMELPRAGRAGASFYRSKVVV